MKYFNLLDWAMKYQKKFREIGRGLWESGNTAETVVLMSRVEEIQPRMSSTVLFR